MSDIEQLENLIREKKENALAESDNAKIENAKRQEESIAERKALCDLNERLQKLAEPLKGKVGLKITYDNEYPRIRVAFTFLPEEICGALAIAQITCWDWKYNFEAPFSLLFNFPENEKSYNYLTEDEAVKRISDYAARIISGEIPETYRLPPWYILTGKVIGGLAFVATWLVCFLGGFWGVLLGWIPAFISYCLSLYLWPAGILLLCYLISIA